MEGKVDLSPVCFRCRGHISRLSPVPSPQLQTHSPNCPLEEHVAVVLGSWVRHPQAQIQAPILSHQKDPCSLHRLLWWPASSL